MIALRSVGLGGSLLLVAMAGCDRELVAPDPDSPLLASRGGGRAVVAPSNVVATAVSANRVDIAWQDNSDNESGFEVHVAVTGLSGFNHWSTTGPNVTTQSFSGINAEQEYCVKVRGFTARGKSRTYSEFSDSSCASTALPPNAPLRTDVTPLSSSSVAVGWVDNSTNEAGFRVERSLDDGVTWTLVTTTTSSPVTQGGLTSEQPVCYRVIAFNSHGESQPMSDCTTPPAAPSGLAVVGSPAPAIDLTWTDNSAVEDGYEVLRLGFGIIAVVPPNTTSYRDASVSANTQYSYFVRARKDGGLSDPSNIESGVAATTPPAAPSGLDATPQGSSVVYMYWLDNATNEAGFRIERSSDGGATWELAGTTPAGSGFAGVFTDQGRAADQAVCYRVLAFNGVGESAWSNADCTTPPAAPTNLMATPVGGDSVEYSWTDNSGVEDGYLVELYYYYPDLCGYYEYCYYTVELPPNTTSYRVGPDVYFSAVVALKDGGYSDWLFPY